MSLKRSKIATNSSLFLSLRILGNNFRFFCSSNAAAYVWKYIFWFYFRFRKPTVLDYLFFRSWSSQHIFCCYCITNLQIKFQKWSWYHMWYAMQFVSTRTRFRITYLLVSSVHSSSPCHKLPNREKKIHLNIDSSECIQNQFMTSVEKSLQTFTLSFVVASRLKQYTYTAMSNKIQ